jgi:hypothetical protein
MPNNSDFCFRTSFGKKTSGPDNFGASPFRRKTFRRQTFDSYCKEQICRSNIMATKWHFYTFVDQICRHYICRQSWPSKLSTKSLSDKRHMLLCRPNTCLPNDSVADVSTKLVDLTCRQKSVGQKTHVAVSTKYLSAEWQGSWCVD